MTDKKEDITNKEKAIILESKARQIPDNITLERLDAEGITMSQSTLTRHKANLMISIEERAKHIIDQGMLSTHLNLIDVINGIIAGLTNDIEDCIKPEQRAKIRMMLIDAYRQLITAQYDTGLIYEDIARSKANLEQYQQQTQLNNNQDNKAIEDNTIDTSDNQDAT